MWWHGRRLRKAPGTRRHPQAALRWTGPLELSCTGNCPSVVLAHTHMAVVASTWDMGTCPTGDWLMGRGGPHTCSSCCTISGALPGGVTEGAAVVVPPGVASMLQLCTAVQPGHMHSSTIPGEGAALPCPALLPPLGAGVASMFNFSHAARVAPNRVCCNALLAAYARAKPPQWQKVCVCARARVLDVELGCPCTICVL